MKIYITRHGQTDWNAENRVLGGLSDIPLNETGRQQARDGAEALKDIPFTKIYTSPMSRALETAQTIHLSHDCPLIEKEALAEQKFGIFEGISRDDETYQYEKHQFFKPFENGESFLDVAARVYPLLEEIVQESDSDDIVLIVTHGGICRMIHNYFQPMSNEEFASYFLKNCEVEIFETER